MWKGTGPRKAKTIFTRKSEVERTCTTCIKLAMKPQWSRQCDGHAKTDKQVTATGRSPETETLKWSTDFQQRNRNNSIEEKTVFNK